MQASQIRSQLSSIFLTLYIFITLYKYKARVEYAIELIINSVLLT